MEKNFRNYLNDFEWESIYHKNFCVRTNFDSKISEKEIASVIWNKIRKPKVKLKNSNTEIVFFKLKNRVFGTLLEKEIKQDYTFRKAHKRPELHPSSLHPKLAKVLINLTGIRKGNLVDAMCGSGGILIEAGLMGLKPVGYDIDKIMINRARINLDYYKIKDYSLFQKDFNKIKRKINYLVCDLPYGKNTKLSKGLYASFLKQVKNVLKGKGVVVFSKNQENLIKKNKLKIENKFNWYIHKSMSKKIYLIQG